MPLRRTVHLLASVALLLFLCLLPSRVSAQEETPAVPAVAPAESVSGQPVVEEETSAASRPPSV